MESRTLPNGLLFMPINRTIIAEVGSERRIVTPGEMVVMPAGLPQAAHFHGRAPPSIDLLALHLSLTDGHGRDLLQRFPQRFCAIPDWPSSLPVLRRLAERLHADGDDGRAAASIALRALLAEIVIAQGGLLPVPLPDPRIARCLERIANSVAGRLSVEELAQDAGISSRRLRDLFRSATGLSPKDHLIRTRMAEATRLLANPAIRIKDVAGDLGFTTEQEFHACFRRIFGVTPRRWRQGASI